MTDIEIAHQKELIPIKNIINKLNINEDYVDYYGKYKAKIDYTKIDSNKNGKLILVTAISPTPYGEGKTTVSIGLADALNKLNQNAVLALREPSLGPVFGMKGGATGGGYSQIVPMEDINLHFTGDFHAITAANNLIASAIDNHLYFGNELNIDPNTISFSRCLDINDRALRSVLVGNSMEKEVKRYDHFNITAASEIMTTFCLANDLEDLRARVDDILIGYTYDLKEVHVKDLKVTGSVIALLQEALKPNLVQTLEGTPAFVHGGPFANIAHGCNTVIATKLATKIGDYVVTEAGFGSDLGAEKFLDIKCPSAGITPNVIVLVATLKALKYNAGIEKEEILKENVEAIKVGSSNLLAHLNNLKSYNIPVVVCLNKYKEDTIEEINVLAEIVKEAGAEFEVSTAYVDGGAGAIELAKKVMDTCAHNQVLHHPYDENDSIKEKIFKVATKIYHAGKVGYSDIALDKIKVLENSKYKNYPVCIAKTQYSLSDDPKKLGAPTGFNVTVKDVRVYAGAKFITVLLGDIMTMPGLPKKPNYEQIDVRDGQIIGLF